MVFIISGFHRYSNSVLQYLSELSLHNDIVLIKVVDTLEAQIPSEKLVVTNKTYQINLNGKDKQLKGKLERSFENNYKNFKEELEKYEITIFKINTTDPIEEQLIEVFTNYNQ